VQKEVRAAWLTEKNRGLADAAAALSKKYRVQLDPSVRTAIEGAPLAAPLLRKQQ
jgi:hypothetical protein